MSLKSHSHMSQHKKTIFVTYVTMVVVFLCMLAINIFAYLTIIRMTKMQSSLEHAAITIKLQAINSNLLFREIISGHSKKDMNAVWDLIEEAKTRVVPLEQIGERKNLEDKINDFKDVLLKCYKARNDPPEKTVGLQDKYDKSFNAIIKQVAGVEDKLREMIRKKMGTFNLLYVALFVNFIILIAFTFFTFTRYVTQRKRVEEELWSTQDNLNTVLNSLDSMLITMDSQGVIMQWNNAAAKYFGVSDEDAVDHTVWAVIPFLKNYQKKIETVFHSQKGKDMYREKVDDKFYNISLNYSSGIDAVILRIDDVTKHEMLDQQMRQSQKMEVVENLVGGLAHDFNNVLGAITGTISMMKFSLDNKEQNIEDLKGNVDVIESSTERAVVMVQELLNLSQKHSVSLAPVDLNMSVKHILRICENTFDKRVELIAELYDVKVMVMADPAQIEQILLNLCDNAVQSMTVMKPDESSHGGKLTIAIDKVYPDKKYRETHPKAVKNSYWIVSIADTGVGMDHETMGKIFDPFYTTKKEGTGMGLSMVNDIIQQHNGFIEVSSQPGAGSKFSVFLPELVREGDERSGQEPKAKDEEKIPVGSGLIFVVDDEAVMRKTSKGILEKLGYSVVFAENGEQAVEVFRERHEEIQVTLLDMAMPKKNGREAYVEMKAIDPNLKVLLVSGFKRDDRIDEVLKLGVNGFIKKPFSLIILAQEIKKLINSSSTAKPSADSGSSEEEGPSIREYDSELSNKVSASGTVIMKAPVSPSGTAILKAHEIPVPENKK